MSPTGKEAIYPVHVMSCTKCNEIFNDIAELNDYELEIKQEVNTNV